MMVGLQSQGGRYVLHQYPQELHQPVKQAKTRLTLYSKSKYQDVHSPYCSPYISYGSS